MELGIGISIIILLITGLMYYRTFLESPKLQIDIGNPIGLVKNSSGGTNKIHMDCTFSNTSTNFAVINDLETIISDKDNHNYVFKWFQFYQYKQREHRESQSRPVPLVISKNNPIQKGVEFRTENNIVWKDGSYSLEVRAYDKKHRTIYKDDKNIFNIDIQNSGLLIEPRQVGGPFFVDVELKAR